MIYILCHFSIEFFYLLPSVFILVRCGFLSSKISRHETLQCNSDAAFMKSLLKTDAFCKVETSLHFFKPKLQVFAVASVNSTKRTE